MYNKLFIKEMKKRNLKSIEFLKTLNTKRLLAYYKKHRNYAWIELCGYDAPLFSIYQPDEETKLYNEDCQKYVTQIKQLLDKREHITRN